MWIKETIIIINERGETRKKEEGKDEMR